MKKNEFLNELRDNLNRFPYEERESAIAYYAEFFEDAGADNEQAVISSLGDPKELAQTILKESGVDTEDTANSNPAPTFTPPQTAYAAQSQSNNNSTRTALIILIIIITFPIWIGFVSGALGLLVGLLTIPFALLIAFGAITICSIVFGAINLFVNPAFSILLFGIGFICIGLTILVVAPLTRLLFSGIKALFQGIGRLFKNIFSGRS